MAKGRERPARDHSNHALVSEPPTPAGTRNPRHPIPAPNRDDPGRPQPAPNRMTSTDHLAGAIGGSEPGRWAYGTSMRRLPGLSGRVLIV
jgi:hypothetical protein